jgi:hypothetical protein
MRRPAAPLLAALILTAPAGVAAQTTERQYLSGTDKDHTVPWELMVTGGRRAGTWSTIPVPSNWELHGFGTYEYGGPPPVPTSRALPPPLRGPARVAGQACRPRLRGLDDRHRGLD